MRTPESSRLQRRYAVFISYSHADNKEQGRLWASWQHNVLETYMVSSHLDVVLVR